MSWLRDAVEALRQIVLIEDRIHKLSEQVKVLADTYSDLDRRLNRMEAKFELLEHFAASNRHSLPSRSRK
jgi:hypothetical protein